MKPQCRLCEKSVNEIKGWLERVNPIGEIGIWECRPTCDSNLTQDKRLLGAIESESPSSDIPIAN